MNLENIMLIERGQIGKHHNTASFLLYEESRIGKSVGTESRQVVARGWLEGGSGSDCLKAGGNFLLRERLSAVD